MFLAVLAGGWGHAAAAASPPFRVRITTDEVAATVSAPGGLRVLDRGGRPIWRDRLGEKLTFVAESTKSGPVVYRAQVASLASEAKARELAAELGKRLGVPAQAHYHPDRSAWRVRVGEGSTPQELDSLVQSLGALGYQGVWVTEDAPLVERGNIRLVDAAWNDHLATQDVLRVVPVRSSDRLQVGEGSYRGVLDVMLDRRGHLAVIKADPADTGRSLRQFFHYQGFAPGLGWCVTTYRGDGTPLPSFAGEPYPLPLSGDSEALADEYWECLNGDNRVALAGKSIDPGGGTSTLTIRNRFEQRGAGDG
ncbi:MAG: SPOR domain-containing protein [SAR324 cluster bacterium]|nr:SPOR domain-containing protein [SAR324 cluster bacterium]